MNDKDKLAIDVADHILTMIGDDDHMTTIPDVVELLVNVKHTIIRAMHQVDGELSEVRKLMHLFDADTQLNRHLWKDTIKGIKEEALDGTGKEKATTR